MKWIITWIVAIIVIAISYFCFEQKTTFIENIIIIFLIRLLMDIED